MDFAPVTSIDSEVEQDCHYNLLPWENHFDLKENFYFFFCVHSYTAAHNVFSLWTWTSALLHKQRHTCMSLFRRQTKDGFSIASTCVTLVWTAFVHLEFHTRKSQKVFLDNPSVLNSWITSFICLSLFLSVCIFLYIWVCLSFYFVSRSRSPLLFRRTLLSVHLSITILFTTQFN